MKFITIIAFLISICCFSQSEFYLASRQQASSVSPIYTSANAANPNPETTGQTMGFVNAQNSSYTTSTTQVFDGVEAVYVDCNGTYPCGYEIQTTGINIGDEIRVRYRIFIEGSGTGNHFARTRVSDGWQNGTQQNIGQGNRNEWVQVDRTDIASENNPNLQGSTSSVVTGITGFYIDEVILEKGN